jgi:phage gpG-like protein
MSLNFKIIKTPEDTVTRAKLTKARERMVGTGAPLVYKKISVFLDQWVQRNFKAQGAALKGDVWPRFAIGGRRRKGGGIDTSAKLLQDTGALRISHLPFSSNSDAGIGSWLPYSKFHQEGIGVPRRRTLPERVEVSDAISQLFNEHVKRALL